MEINIELIEKIKTRIKKEPELFHMGISTRRVKFKDGNVVKTRILKSIGDLAVELSGTKHFYIPHRKYLLGIESGEDYLFDLRCWEKINRQNYRKAREEKDYKKLAEIVCRQIDWFVAEYKKGEFIPY
jgi:hypothetical protein